MLLNLHFFILSPTRQFCKCYLICHSPLICVICIYIIFNPRVLIPQMGRVLFKFASPFWPTHPPPRPPHTLSRLSPRFPHALLIPPPNLLTPPPNLTIQEHKKYFRTLLLVGGLKGPFGAQKETPTLGYKNVPIFSLWHIFVLKWKCICWYFHFLCGNSIKNKYVPCHFSLTPSFFSLFEYKFIAFRVLFVI